MLLEEYLVTYHLEDNTFSLPFTSSKNNSVIRCNKVHCFKYFCMKWETDKTDKNSVQMQKLKKSHMTMSFVYKWNAIEVIWCSLKSIKAQRWLGQNEQYYFWEGAGGERRFVVNFCFPAGTFQLFLCHSERARSQRYLFKNLQWQSCYSKSSPWTSS